MICKNCNNTLDSTSDYCNSCGAKIIRNRLTLKNLFEHFSEQFLNYDNKFLKTFIHLFTKPDQVIGCYINGTRKRYVNVISYFAIALTLSGFQMFILNKFFPDLMNMDFLAQNGTAKMQQNNFAFVQEYNSFIYMLIVPVYALISKLVFYNYKQYNFTEHLVINMYIAAHLSIVSSLLILFTSILGVNFGIIGLLTIPLQIVFSAYCFKLIFNLNTKKLILKTLLFLLILLVLFILFSILFGIIMFLNGDFEEIRKAQEAARKTQKAINDSISN